MSSSKRNLLYIFWVSLTIILIGFLTFNFASPWHITFPEKEELQIRFQLVLAGEDIDFAATPFQETSLDAVCQDDLANRPLGFFGGNSQTMEVLWEGAAGVEILRNYGFNNSGPFAGYLGVRLDKFPEINPVPIHAQLLETPKEYEYFVYTGDSSSYTRRDEVRFLNDSITDFIENKSSYNYGSINANAQISTEKGEDLNLTDFIEDVENGNAPSPTVIISNETFKEELNKNNKNKEGEENQTQSNSIENTSIELIEEVPESYNIIGNIVVFIQRTEPSEEEISEKFLNLEIPQEYNCE